jgi:hypothetical protein
MPTKPRSLSPREQNYLDSLRACDHYIEEAQQMLKAALTDVGIVELQEYLGSAYNTIGYAIDASRRMAELNALGEMRGRTHRSHYPTLATQSVETLAQKRNRIVNYDEGDESP